MASVKQELVDFGKKIYAAGLVAGAGGNISARDGRMIWMKPSGFAMDDMGPDDLCGMELDGGLQEHGSTPEIRGRERVFLRASHVRQHALPQPVLQRFSL